MSTLKVNTINNDGTNATDATNGFTIGGNSIVQTYTSSGDEPTSPSAGDLWWDSTNSVLKRYINSEWKEVATVAPVSWYGDRAVIAGGYGTANSFTIDYFDITTLGNASDFGDLLEHNRTQAGVSDKTYGLFAGGFIASGGSNYYGSTGFANGIEYVTISTTANSGDFGDLTVAREGTAGVSDGTYGVFGGGYASGTPNVIDYVTIASTGNATNFGDLTQFTYYLASANDATRGLFAGGAGPFNTISYVTMASTGNATDFGDLTQARQNPGGAGNDTYGVFVGGQTNTATVDTMDYVTIQTTSNATDFGNLTSARHSAATTGNATRGVAAGGETPSAKVNTIDYFAFDTPANAVDFGDLTEARRSAAAVSGNPS